MCAYTYTCVSIFGLYKKKLQMGTLRRFFGLKISDTKYPGWADQRPGSVLVLTFPLYLIQILYHHLSVS